MKEKYYLEHQTLGRRVVCAIGPANQRIILQIDGFLVRGKSEGIERKFKTEKSTLDLFF